MAEFVGLATGHPLLAVVLLLITAAVPFLVGSPTARLPGTKPRPPDACNSRSTARTPPNVPPWCTLAPNLKQLHT
jgi:hypothetical protein